MPLDLLTNVFCIAHSLKVILVSGYLVYYSLLGELVQFFPEKLLSVAQLILIDRQDVVDNDQRFL